MRTLLSIGLVTDINQVDVSPRDLVDVAGTLYFTRPGPGGSGKTELWKSDGTGAGTTQVGVLPQFSPETSGTGPRLVAAGDTIYYQGFDSGTSGTALFKTDGTAGGAVEVAPVGINSGLVAAGGRLYFTACDGFGTGTRLWTSDGTPDGTVPLTAVGRFGVGPTNLTAAGDRLFFTAYDAASGNYQLWTSDGTAAGTTQLTAFPEVGVGDSVAVSFTGLADLGGTLYFGVGTSSNPATASLWTSDGTVAGTKQLDLGAGVASISGAPARSGDSIFFAGGGSLYKTDGTASGTVKLASTDAFGGFANLTSLGNGSILATTGDGAGGVDLWASDGTPGGTAVLKDFAAGLAGGNGTTRPAPTVVGGVAYFSANDADAGQELWRSDGTAAGTTLARDIFAGPGSSSPQQLTSLDSRVFFVAHDGSGVNQLWKSDGASGAVLVKGFTPPGRGAPILWT